ncbi:MAG TPA: hypothetical protein VMC09_14380 [Anaerolineales bacterium]|nr:hypothetical protein [Anaerolineales bacterium]
MIGNFDGLLWFLAALVGLVFLQRILHREIQAAFLILTRRPGVTQAIFALIFLPGVFLHELSHFLTAKILGVPTGKFSLIPQAQPDGKLRLGYVETGSGGFIRDALIGVAPLVSGGLFVAYAAIYQLHLLPLWDLMRAAEWTGFWANLISVLKAADFWLWFYLTFTVSSTMMPSASDRHAWLPMGLFLAGLIGLAVLFGAGSWMLTYLAPPFNSFLRATAMIFGLSGFLHAILIVPFLLAHRVLTRLTGMDIG